MSVIAGVVTVKVYLRFKQMSLVRFSNKVLLYVSTSNSTVFSGLEYLESNQYTPQPPWSYCVILGDKCVRNRKDWERDSFIHVTCCFQGDDRVSTLGLERAPTRQCTYLVARLHLPGAFKGQPEH